MYVVSGNADDGVGEASSADYNIVRYVISEHISRAVGKVKWNCYTIKQLACG